MHDGPRILILGGGFGGVMAARELGKRLSRAHDARVILIDRDPAHVFIPLLYEVSTAFIEHGAIGSSQLFDSGIAVDYPSMLSRWGVDFVQAEIAGIDWAARTVALKGREAMPFDHVIVGLGSEVNYYGIEGLEEHAMVLKSLRDADRLRQEIHDLLHRTERGDEERMDVLIGGAGATGAELAAELTLFIRKHLMKGHLDPSDFRIGLVEAQAKPLPVMEDPFPSWAKGRLENLGVKLYLDTCIQKVSADKVTLAPRPLKDGESVEQLVCDFRTETHRDIDADIVVWTGGIKGSSALEALDVPLEGRGGRIKVGNDLRIPGRRGAYAIGDAVELTDPSTGLPVPWLAQAAMEQGVLAARNIVADIEDREPSTYSFRKYPVIVTLGGKYGIASVGTAKLRGFKVWLLREAADLRYFLKLLPFWRALHVWWQGIKIYSRND